MKLSLVYGRSGSGKSEYIYKKISEAIGNEKIFLIVPEQCNLSAEKKLFETSQKTSLIDVEVLTLSRMAFRVLNECGNTTNRLSKAGKNMLIYDLLTKEKKNLNFLGKSEKNVEIIDRMFTELKKHCTTLDDLKKVETQNTYTDLKINDIRTLYSKYEEKIANSFLDENDTLTILASLLDQTDMFDNTIVFIDEFLGFTPQEYAIFEKLINKCKEITVTVPTNNLKEEKIEKDIFYFNKKYASKLLKIAKENKIDIEEISLEKNYRAKNNELKFLEENLYSSTKKYMGECENISLYLAANPYLEIEYVAKSIHNLVKKCGYNYSEIGIISEDVEKYSEDVKSIFAKYNIPLFVDEKKQLNQNILIKFIISMLEIFTKNWSYEAVFNYLKIGLLDINRDDIYLLENYCMKWGIRGNKWYAREFNYEQINERQEKLENLRKQIITPLIKFKNEVSDNKTVTEITRKIYNFFIENNINEVLDKKLKLYGNIEISDEYNTSYKLLISILDDLNRVFKDEKITFEKYKELLEVGLNSCKLGKIPATQDQIVFGDTERTRSNKLKILFVIGINDGCFPQVNKQEGFLNDNDRKLLQENGIELAKDSTASLYEEQFNIYRTLTTPEEKLYLLYSSQDKDGTALRPSILIKKIKRMYPKLEETSDIINKNYILTNEIASFEDALNIYKAYLDEGIEPSEEWKSVLRYFYKKDKKRFDRAVSGTFYSNKAQEVSKENIEKLYGKTLKTSISRLEQYRKCPFSFHLTYGLNLKEKEELKVEAIDTGSFMHEVIDMFFKKIDEGRKNLKEISEEEIKVIVEKIIKELLETTKYYIFSSSAKYRLLCRRLKKVIYESILYIVYSLKYSDFSILGHEIEFSNTGKYKTIKLDIDDKSVEIKGKIDRVDIAKLSDKQYVRIIDYKSSMKDLDLNQVYAGLQIQLITYLDAICEQTDFEASGVLYMGLIDNIVKNAKNLSEEEIENKIRNNFKMKGLILADISVVKLMDNKLQTGSSDIIPVYIGKDGTLSQKKSSIIDKENFDNLQKEVKQIIREISKEILKGKIDIKPYNYKKKTGCDYCSYKSICMFNTNIKGNEYNYINNLKEG